MIINIYLSPPPYPIHPGADFHIGVEKGALYALESGIPLDLIIGDFDSVSPLELKYLETLNIPIIKHASEKDQTDAELALSEAIKKDPTKVYIHTSSGPRIDHLYANLRNLMPGISYLVGPTFKAYRLLPGTYEIKGSHRYISMFALKTVQDLELKGFKYQGLIGTLEPDEVKGISNEKEGTVTFSAGELLIIESKD